MGSEENTLVGRDSINLHHTFLYLRGCSSRLQQFTRIRDGAGPCTCLSCSSPTHSSPQTNTYQVIPRLLEIIMHQLQVIESLLEHCNNTLPAEVKVPGLLDIIRPVRWWVIVFFGLTILFSNWRHIAWGDLVDLITGREEIG